MPSVLCLIVYTSLASQIIVQISTITSGNNVCTKLHISSQFGLGIQRLTGFIINRALKHHG